MGKADLRKITNHFQDVRLVSLAAWKQANEIVPRDRSGPYVVLQNGYDPQDINCKEDEFVLGRSGKWLSLTHFYRLPVPERREEFVFGTAAEVMQTMENLASKVSVFGRPEAQVETTVAPENDEMAKALEAARKKGSTTSSTDQK